MSVSVINIDLPTSSEPCDIKSSALSSSSQPIFLDPADMPATSRTSRQRSSKGAQQSEDNVIDLSQEEDEPVSPRKRQRTSSVGNRSRRGSRQPLEALSPSLCDNWGNSKKRMTVQQAKRNNNDKDGDDDEVQVVEAPMKLTATRRSSGNVKQEDSIQTQQSIASSQPKPTQKPRKGDRFRVFYDIGDDAFGTERPGGKGWHFGHIISVKRSKTPYEVRIHFDNGEKVRKR